MKALSPLLLLLHNTKSQIFEEKNIPVYNAQKAQGVSFGFSTTITQQKQILVGAPRANENLTSDYQGNRWVGEIHTCEFNAEQNSIECNQNDKNGYKSIGNNNRHEFDLRYNGMNIQSNSKGEVLKCAPASIKSDASVQNGQSKFFGYCELQTNGKTISIAREPGKTTSPDRNPVGNQKLFGFTSSIDDRVFSAPIAYNERGALSTLKELTEIPEYTTVNDIDTRRGWENGDIQRVGKSLAVLNCGTEKYACAGTSDPDGAVKVVLVGSERSARVFEFRAEKIEREFGSSFGSSLAAVKINGIEYLLVGSPFGASGRIDLYDVCGSPELPKRKTDDLLVLPDESLPKNFGFSMTNVGNIDSALGEEVLVGAPTQKDGKVLVFSVRNGKLTYIQTVSSPELEYFGLAISDIAVNLDDDAASDVVVSGKDGIAVILTKPSFSLKSSVDFNFKNTMLDSSKAVIKVNKHAAQEELTICLDIKANVKGIEKGVMGTIALDSKRDSGSARWQLSNFENLKTVEFLKSGSKYCSQRIFIQSGTSENWNCPEKSKTNGLYDDLLVEVSDLKSKANVEAIFNSKESFSMQKVITPDYRCKNSCENSLTVSVNSIDTDLALGEDDVNKMINVVVSNTHKYDIYGTFVEFEVTKGIRITDSKCRAEENPGNSETLVYLCDIGCPILKKTTGTANRFKLNFDDVNGQKNEYSVRYWLHKDGKRLTKSNKHQGVVKFPVIVKINAAINEIGSAQYQISKSVNKEKDELKVTPHFPNHLLRWKIKNNDAVNYKVMDVAFKVPILFTKPDGVSIEIFKENEFSILDTNGPICDTGIRRAKVFKKDQLSASEWESKSQNMKANEHGISYKEVMCSPSTNMMSNNYGSVEKKQNWPCFCENT